FSTPHRPYRTDTSTLSLHDALPISARLSRRPSSSVLNAIRGRGAPPGRPAHGRLASELGWHGSKPICSATVAGLRGAGVRAYHLDRKSTRLNSSHVAISYAVFCLKK